MALYRYPNAVLAVLAKAPVPGLAKTRLIPALGPEGAARLHADLLRMIVSRLLAARLCPVRLCCHPDTDHPEFAALAADGAQLERQLGTELGERMATAARHALERAHYAILIGTDIPELDPGYVESAIQALRVGQDAVLGPVEDGGYCLLGLRRREDTLFWNMAWSTAEVAAETRRRLRHLGWRWHELPVLWDVDGPEDLPRYAAWKRGAKAGES